MGSGGRSCRNQLTWVRAFYLDRNNDFPPDFKPFGSLETFGCIGLVVVPTLPIWAAIVFDPGPIQLLISSMAMR